MITVIISLAQFPGDINSFPKLYTELKRISMQLEEGNIGNRQITLYQFVIVLFKNLVLICIFLILENLNPKFLLDQFIYRYMMCIIGRVIKRVSYVLINAHGSSTFL